MTKVMWGNMRTEEKASRWQTLGMLEPDRLLPTLAKERVGGKNHYLQCPSFIDTYKNTFIVRSPVDFTLTINNDGTFITDKLGQDFIDNHVLSRVDQIGDGDPLLFSCNFFLFFIPDRPCTLELMPAHMHSTELLKSVRVIPGRLNPHYWPRAIDFAFELVGDARTVVFKRGEPLFYVRFEPEDMSKVVLEHTPPTSEMEEVINTVQDLKMRVPRLSLEEMYKLAAKRLNIGVFFKKKCPFRWKR